MNIKWEQGILIQRDVRKVSNTRFQLPPEIKDLFDKGAEERLEEFVLNHVEQAPEDIPWFVPLFRSLVKKDQADEASTYLNFLLEILRERNARNAELELAIICLEFWPDNKVLRDILFSVMKEMYSGSPSFNTLITVCKIKESLEPLIACKQFELWLRYDVGQPVYMAGRGAGRIKEINPTLDTVRAVFEGYGQISFKLDEAERMLESVPPDHFFSIKINNPGMLRELAQKDPGNLLEKLFASIHRQLTLQELKEMLSGIVDEGEWSGWWSKARKDKRLTAGPGTKPVLTWSGSSDEAESKIVGEFREADAKEKLSMAQRYASRSPELARTMGEELLREALAMRDEKPSLSLEIALSIGKLTGADEPAGLIAEILRKDKVAGIVSGISDKAIRRKAVSIIKTDLSDWPAVYLDMMADENDSSNLEAMYDQLRNEGHGERLASFVDQVLSKPSDAPRFYTWLCREIESRPELKARVNIAFLIQMVSSLGNDSLRAEHASLRKLFDPGEPADNIMASLDLEGAKRFLSFLERDTNLESYRKDRIDRILNDAFPKMNESKEQYILVTAGSLEKKRAEFEELVQREIPRNALEIKRTREYGDLRENFEYHAARTRHELLSSRAKTLHDEIASVRVIDLNAVDPSSVQVGTRMILKPVDDGGTMETVTILGPWDSVPDKHIISYTSQVGNAFLGAKPGSRISYNEKEYVIDSIEVYK
jgi:transcription elongation GreA/GreB family factor